MAASKEALEEMSKEEAILPDKEMVVQEIKEVCPFLHKQVIRRRPKALQHGIHHFDSAPNQLDLLPGGAFAIWCEGLVGSV